MRATLTADVLPMVDGRANGAWLEKTTSSYSSRYTLQTYVL